MGEIKRNYLEKLKTYKIISTDLIEKLVAYCSENPQYVGLFVQDAVASGSRLLQVRRIISLIRKEIRLSFKQNSSRIKINNAQILIDADLTSEKRVNLWLPVAYQLSLTGVKIGLVSSKHPSFYVEQYPELADSTWYEFYQVSDNHLDNDKSLVSQLREKLSNIPWKGLFALLLAMDQIWLDKLIRLWKLVLRESDVKLIMTTSPTSFWSSVLMYAGKCEDVTTVQLTQGLPIITWQFPTSDYAFVWSMLGKTLLRKHGWTNSYRIAKNPSILPPEKLEEERKSRRKQLDLKKTDFCVLFLGSKSSDKGFEGKGYLDTCEIVGRGFSLALESKKIIPLLRPHYNEPVPETERVIRNHLPDLLVLNGGTLAQDIAASDLVISLQSAALEEAYLMGKQIIQVAPPNIEPVLTFEPLGTPLVRSPEALSNMIINREWIKEPNIQEYPTVAEQLIELFQKNNSKGIE